MPWTSDDLPLPLFHILLLAISYSPGVRKFGVGDLDKRNCILFYLRRGEIGSDVFLFMRYVYYRSFGLLVNPILLLHVPNR
jgi:hypothetical protein